MNDRVFIDSNVIIYLFGKNEEKKHISKNILKTKPFISIQVLNETANVLNKKFEFELKIISSVIDKLCDTCRVKKISVLTVKSALDTASRYRFSYYDSLIISSALENNCNILYSEDMNDGQIIEGRLKIINPFKNKPVD